MMDWKEFSEKLEEAVQHAEAVSYYHWKYWHLTVIDASLVQASRGIRDSIARLMAENGFDPTRWQREIPYADPMKCMDVMVQAKISLESVIKGIKADPWIPPCKIDDLSPQSWQHRLFCELDRLLNLAHDLCSESWYDSNKASSLMDGFNLLRRREIIEVNNCRHILRPIAEDSSNLSQREADILLALHELGATTSDTRQKKTKVIRQVASGGDPNSWGRVFSSLCTKGLISSLAGPGGGYWLTPAGVQRATSIQINPSPAP